MELPLIQDMGELLKLSRQIENKIRHAEQGYTGISADYRIEEDELNRLYEWDLSMLQTIISLEKMAQELNLSITGQDGTTGGKMKEIKNALREFNSIFDKRISVIADLEVG